MYDFIYKNLTIDVKYRSRNQSSKHTHYDISPSNADVIVAFLERQKGRELKNCYILVIPNSVIKSKSTFTITLPSDRFYSFLVNKDTLRDCLDLYAELKSN